MPSSFSRSFSELSPRTIFRRCVKCPDTSPQCPVCPQGYTCTMISQSCQACASTTCIQMSANSGSPGLESSPSGGGSNAGAIAGGVIGGVAFVALVAFLAWWFVVRQKRKEAYQLSPDPVEVREKPQLLQQQLQQPDQYQYADSRQARKSTHSIASTVLTRASNVIQIAYIPGVTNRTPPDTPGTLVPPVPPLPGASPDQHFFMPGDLRDSSWSDMSDRRSGVAPSLRSSVATTIYRSNAIVSPMPAQQATRTRAAMVSIHSGLSTPSARSPRLDAAHAPQVPPITQAQLTKANGSIVGRPVVAKPVTLTKQQTKSANSSSSRLLAPGAAAPGARVSHEPADSRPSTAASAATSHQFNHMTSSFDNSESDDDDDDDNDNDEDNDNDNDAGDAPSAAASKIITVSVTPAPGRSSASSSEGASSALARQNADVAADSSRHRRSISSGRLVSEVPARGQSPFADINEVK